MLKKHAPLILLCLTLGLAPFVPEPHIVGKIRWILGDPGSMSPVDWFDFLMHGTPWFLLFFSIGRDIIRVKKT